MPCRAWSRVPLSGHRRAADRVVLSVRNVLLHRQLLLKAVRAPFGSSPVPSAPASHPFYRTEAATGAAERRQAKGTATPLFASAAVAAKAAAAAKVPPRPSGKFLMHEVASADKAAVKVAALAKSFTASETASTQSKASLVRARIAKIPLHTAMSIVEKGAAHALAQADKDAVEAALLRATLSVPGQRKAERAAAAAAARAAANKPSAAWLAGAKSLADRNPYAAMHVYTPHQHQLRQHGSTAQRLGSRAAALAHRGRNALSRLSALSHTGYSRDEAAAYKVHAGKHPMDVSGNDKLITTLPRNKEGEIDRPDPAEREYVKKTRSLGTPVKPDEVQAHWAHGYYHPYSIVKQDDRYVPVGRLLTHRDGVTRREMKMPTAQEEDEGGVDTEEEQPPEEEPEAEDCQWGKDVYGRCYTECTDGKDEYGKCHDGSPLWTDPMPLSKLCVGHENATWCQQPEGEEPGNEGDAATKARTVQLASVGGAQGEEVLGGSADVQNAANAPTLAGGIPVAGGKVVWLPLSALSDGAQGKGTAAPTQLPATAGNSFVTASPAGVTPEVPKWDPKVLLCAVASLVCFCVAVSLSLSVVAVHVRWYDARAPLPSADPRLHGGACRNSPRRCSMGQTGSHFTRSTPALTTRRQQKWGRQGVSRKENSPAGVRGLRATEIPPC
jgi:hypothetical protein